MMKQFFIFILIFRQFRRLLELFFLYCQLFFLKHPRFYYYLTIIIRFFKHPKFIHSLRVFRSTFSCFVMLKHIIYFALLPWYFCMVVFYGLSEKTNFILVWDVNITYFSFFVLLFWLFYFNLLIFKSINVFENFWFNLCFMVFLMLVFGLIISSFFSDPISCLYLPSGFLRVAFPRGI